jgi:hypothetical protein
MGSSRQQPNRQVLVLANSSTQAYGHQTHAPDSKWAHDTGLAYVAVPASTIPVSMGQCRHCCGGR